jgi:hypothetical protein
MIDPANIALTAERLKEIENYVAGTPQHLLDKDHLRSPARTPQYAFESPIEATLNYVRAYRSAFINTFGIAPDCDDTIAPGSSEWIKVVEMRQTADLYIGASYGDVLRIAFSRNKRNPRGTRKPGSFRNLRDLPSFNRKFHKERSRFYGSIVGLEAPAKLSSAAYAALPSQDLYRRFLLGSAKLSHSWPSLVQSKVIREKILTIDDVKRSLKSMRTEEIRTTVDRIVGQVIPQTSVFVDPIVQPEELVETCFGLPSSSIGPYCKSCPLLERCQDLASDLRPLVPNGGQKLHRAVRGTWSLN